MWLSSVRGKKQGKAQSFESGTGTDNPDVTKNLPSWVNSTSCCCATHNHCGFFNYMALFTSQKRQPLSQILKEEPCVRNVHCMCICLHLSELEPHETCSLSIIPLRVGRCGESARVVHLSPAHLFLSGLYVQNHVSGSAVWAYRPAFCVWLTGVRPSCTLSLITFRTHVLNLGRVSALILTKKGHITYIQMFVSLRCFQSVKYSCLPCAFYM